MNPLYLPAGNLLLNRLTDM